MNAVVTVSLGYKKGEAVHEPTKMSLPILFHYFSTPLPYLRTLALQQSIHDLQLQSRRKGRQSPDILLLLQHRPVYTGGKRQDETALADERSRLRNLGADWIPTSRGGETTFHGPGQFVAYPLMDLGRMSVRGNHFLTSHPNSKPSPSSLSEIMSVPYRIF